MRRVADPARGPRGRAGAALALAALALVAAGCGDDALWSRWRAERGLWRAERALERIEIGPRLASPADWSRAEAACAAVTRRFPAVAWAARLRGGAPCAAEVLEASGRVAILHGRIEELRDRPAAALRELARATRDYSALPRVALSASVERARLLERLGRGADAEEAWTRVARDFPPADPESGAVFDDVLDAPLRVAEVRRARGDVRGSDSVLREAESAYLRLLPREQGRSAAPALWARLGTVRTARNDPAGARRALRAALADPASRPLAPGLVLDLARSALAAGQPDTALAYAGWAADGFDGSVRPEALLLRARALREAGEPDSALRAYDALLDAAGEDPAGITARFERARLLEDLGRWDQARGEYHALASLWPTHPLAFEALLRLVRYPLARGQPGLARIEARRALEALEALAASQDDDSVQVRAGETRSRLLFETGDLRGGCGVLAAMLRRDPEAPIDGALLLGAAECAETRLDDDDLAVELYRAAAVRAPSPEARRRAREAADRLAARR